MSPVHQSSPVIVDRLYKVHVCSGILSIYSFGVHRSSPVPPDIYSPDIILPRRYRWGDSIRPSTGLTLAH